MEKQAFLEDLSNILDVEASELNDNYPLNEGNWESLAVVGAISAIDEYFDVIIDGEALAKCASVGELLQLIQNQADV